MPDAVAQRLVQGLAEADPDVLDGVVGAGLQIAAGLHGEIEAAVARQQVEHVVEEPDAGVALALAVAVQRQRQVDVGLSGPAVDLGGTCHHVPLSRMRASRDLACSSKPSARAMGAAAAASAAASEPIRTSV